MGPMNSIGQQISENYNASSLDFLSAFFFHSDDDMYGCAIQHPWQNLRRLWSIYMWVDVKVEALSI